MFKFVLVALLFCFHSFLYGKDEIRFGVFAYLGHEKTKEKYQPLIDYLNTQMTKKVVLEVLTQEEMDLKIKNKELDIATTNPTHFLVVRHNEHLSGAIATLISKSNDMPVTSLAGVILVRNDSQIKTIKDIKNKSIATPSLKHMGGFRAQAYALYLNGIDAIKDNKKIITTEIHQKAIEKMMSGEVDVAFVRDGIYEQMVQDGTLKGEDVRVINEQRDIKYPFKISTKLYPEWPVFALPYADTEDIKKVLSALLAFDANSIYAQKSDIYGYTLPADYLVVEDLARALRLPPYETIGFIHHEDIWAQHKEDLIVLILFLLVIAYYFYKTKRQNIFIASLLKNIGEGIYGVDRRGNCIWINQKALDMLGFKEREVLDLHQHYLFHHHHIDNSEYLEVDCPIHKTTHDKQTRNCTEYFIKKDGTMFPVSLTVAPTSDGAVVVFRDISEVKNYEEKLKIEVAQKTQELQELNNSLEEKIELALDKNKKQQAMLEQQSRLAALGEMIGNIAHQWRQPLSVITTTITGLQVKYDFGMPVTQEMVHEVGDSIVKQANYLSKTIDDFRDFIKNDNTEELFFLSKVIYDTANILQATLNSNHIELLTDVDESITYKGYPNQLSQAILNIINNAKDAFKNQENDKKKILLSIQKIDNKILIRISDNAGGIPKEIKEKIFDPYFTTKHQSVGTGLGLYISANIIQKYFNGKIYIEDVGSGIDKGTTFVIEIVCKIDKYEKKEK